VTTPSDHSRPFAYRFIVALLRPLMMLFTKRDWAGAENLPEGGYVAVTNHYSYLEPLVFGHFLVDNGHTPHYLGKIEVFRIPFVGAILRAAEQIPVHRESGLAVDAYRSALDAVRRGCCVAIYPEGSLTRDPGLWPMRGKTGAARVVLETGCPVVPITTWGAADILPTYGRRVHLLPRKTMVVRAGPPVDLDDLRELDINAEVLAVATARIMAALTSQLEEIRGEVAPVTRFDPRAHGITSTGKPKPLKEAS